MSENKPKKKTYKISPMAVEVKTCVDQLIVVHGRQITYEKWLYRREDYPCPVCGKPDDVKFMRHLVGVYRICSWCGFSERVSPRVEEGADKGGEKAYLLNSRTIARDEARKILISDSIGKQNRLRWEKSPLIQGRPRRGRRRPLEGLEEE